MKSRPASNRSYRRVIAGILSLSYTLLLSGTHALAQVAPAKPEPPEGAMLNPAPEFSQWLTTFSYPADRAKKDPGAPPNPLAAIINSSQTVSITTTKTKNIIHEAVVAQVGTIDIWYVSDIQYKKSDGSPLWIQDQAVTGSHAQANSSYSPLPTSGFRDVSWISRTTYVGTTKLNNQNCLVFAQHAPAKIDLSNPAILDSLESFALVDAQTRLPVQIKDNDGIIRFFKFTAGPDSLQPLPPDLAAQIKKGEEGTAHLNERPSKPY